VIVGDGYHRRAGTPHAEVHALEAAGARAAGATLYCTLEPCCHVGRTGPCVERIVAAGIARVVAAVTDPNPLVAGKGFAYLRNRGIEVVEGVEAGRRPRPQRPVLHVDSAPPAVRHREGRHQPRRADCREARRADADHRSRSRGAWCTGCAPRWTRSASARARCSATTRCSPRGTSTGRGPSCAWCSIAACGRPAARLFTTLDDGPVIILTSERAVAAAPDRASSLEAAGARLVRCPDDSLGGALRYLGTAEVQSLLLEGGASLHAAAWDAGMIDRILLFVAPRVLGPEGVPVFAGRPVATAALHDVRVEPCGDDVLIQGDVHRVD
jgi:diaminohydroxyphosphoribosylaminopyrimidine deaminase / 5-amino-6-(5-phosphoribosylamino)uracil reductase